MIYSWKSDMFLLVFGWNFDKMLGSELYKAWNMKIKLSTAFLELNFFKHWVLSCHQNIKFKSSESAHPGWLWNWECWYSKGSQVKIHFLRLSRPGIFVLRKVRTEEKFANMDLDSQKEAVNKVAARVTNCHSKMSAAAVWLVVERQPTVVVRALLVIILSHSGQTLRAMHLFRNVTSLPLLGGLLGLTWKINPTSDKQMASKPLNLMMLSSLAGDRQSSVHWAQLHWSS